MIVIIAVWLHPMMTNGKMKMTSDKTDKCNHKRVLAKGTRIVWCYECKRWVENDTKQDKEFNKQFPSYNQGVLVDDCVYCQSDPPCVDREWVEENCIDKHKIKDIINKDCVINRGIKNHLLSRFGLFKK